MEALPARRIKIKIDAKSIFLKTKFFNETCIFFRL